MKSQRTKNTLLKNAQANAKAIFLREYFFPHPKRNSNFFSPTLRCFIFFCQRTMQTWTDIAFNVNRLGQSVCWPDNSPHRTVRRASANRVDGLTGFFIDEVRLSHHCTYGSRIQRFIKLWRNL